MLDFIKKIIKYTISPYPHHNSYLHKLRCKIPIFFLNSNTSMTDFPVFKKARGFFLFLTTNSYISIVLRPKYSRDINIRPFQKGNNDTSILIQGPITNNIKFLTETVKIYKKNFPKTDVILSMWDYEEKLLNTYLKENFNEIIINKGDDVNNPAIGNLNLQTQSTFKGLEYIQKCKKKFTIKQRADGRIYNPNCINFFKNLSKSFPTNSKEYSRILVSNIGTMKYRFFCLSDLLLFGTTNDLLKYFKNECYEVGLKKIDSKINLKFPIKNGVPITVETFLCMRYMKNFNVNLKLNQSCWRKILKKYFLIFDVSSIDFFFKKHGYHFEERQIKTYSNIDHEAINFSDWLDVYYNDKQIWPQNNFEKFIIKKNIWTKTR